MDLMLHSIILPFNLVDPDNFKKQRNGKNDLLLNYDRDYIGLYNSETASESSIRIICGKVRQSGFNSSYLIVHI